MSGAAVKRALGALLDALYPPNVACALCGREALLGEDRLCAGCRASLKPGIVEDCPPALDGIVAAYRYEGGAVAGIHALKYTRQTRLAPFFADAIALPADWAFDCIVPVPLHPLKLWQRTYNQSELIARALGERLHTPVLPALLKRTRYTKTQTALTEFERAKNVSRAFFADPRAAGRAILLVDDVTTTHSTLAACALALRQAGAARVYAACAASAAHHTRETEPPLTK